MAIGDKPPKVTIRNLVNGNTLTAQANPPEFDESIEVNYNRLEVPGMGHQVLQYKNTSNYKIEFELEYLAASRSDMKQLQAARNFLFSLGYSKRGAADVPTGGPPRVLFTWPEMIGISAVLVKLNVKHDRFNLKAKSYHFKAKITLEEIRDVRLLMEDVEAKGMLRSTGAAAPPASGTGGVGPPSSTAAQLGRSPARI